ncbi:MAG: recombination mediator RecR [Bacteroidales bacterium]|jgi:recombination protein RecR|nr:recombination mediator RecR [Bacteroidales bacterium]
MQEYSSKLLENAINQIAKLPGIGRRTAIRLALYFLKQSSEDVSAFVSAISDLYNKVFYCDNCHNISDSETCEICRNPKRNKSLICVVQDIRDVIAIENTHAYQGVYHVLGGVISPMNGIGIEEINLQSLFDRLVNESIEELVLALPSTTEGDTTSYYIYKYVQSMGNPVKVTVIARGLSVGDELEYVDEITLSRSLLNRLDFELSILKK